MSDKFFKVDTFKNKPGRFAIYDVNGVLLDDAQGYGYKSYQNAEKAGWYKFSGGKAKMDSRKQKAARFKKENPKAAKYIENFFEMNFKEISRGEMSDDDLVVELKEQFGLDFDKNLLNFM
jgi:hypothetical protein